MPIASLLLDDCSEVKDYVKKNKEGIIKMECYLIPKPHKKVLLIIIYPIMYVLEFAIFNGLFRWFVSMGLKKKGYRCTITPVSRIEIVRLLLNER